MANGRPRMQLLSRYEIVAPGCMHARGSYALFGVIFLGAGLALEAIPVTLLLRGPWDGRLWILVVFGALFVLTGFWIAGIREDLEVGETGLHDVVRTWTSAKEAHAARAMLDAVRLSVRVTGSGKDRSVQYVAALVVRDSAFPKILQVVAKRDEAGARRAAEEIAGCLGVRFEDAMGDEVIVVEPDALGNAHPERVEAAEPIPAGVRIGQAIEGPEVWMHGTLRPGAAALATGVGALIFLGGVALAAAGASMVKNAVVGPVFMGAVVGVPGLFFAGWGLLSRRARERVRILPAEIVRETYLGGLRYGTRRVPRAEIESLRIQTRSADGYGLAVVTDRRRLLVGRGLQRAGLDWLRAWLSRQP